MIVHFDHIDDRRKAYSERTVRCYLFVFIVVVVSFCYFIHLLFFISVISLLLCVLLSHLYYFYYYFQSLLFDIVDVEHCCCYLCIDHCYWYVTYCCYCSCCCVVVCYWSFDPRSCCYCCWRDHFAFIVRIIVDASSPSRCCWSLLRWVDMRWCCYYPLLICCCLFYYIVARSSFCYFISVIVDCCCWSLLIYWCSLMHFRYIALLLLFSRDLCAYYIHSVIVVVVDTFMMSPCYVGCCSHCWSLLLFITLVMCKSVCCLLDYAFDRRVCSVVRVLFCCYYCSHVTMLLLFLLLVMMCCSVIVCCCWFSFPVIVSHLYNSLYICCCMLLYLLLFVVIYLFVWYYLLLFIISTFPHSPSVPAVIFYCYLCISFHYCLLLLCYFLLCLILSTIC